MSESPGGDCTGRNPAQMGQVTDVAGAPESVSHTQKQEGGLGSPGPRVIGEGVEIRRQRRLFQTEQKMNTGCLGQREALRTWRERARGLGKGCRLRGPRRLRTPGC